MTAADHDAAVRAALADLLPDWTDVSNVAFLPGGYSNRNYRFRRQGRDYVLRVPLRAQPFVDRTHEALWYAGLPASVGVRPIALDEVSGLMVTPWLHGELLVDVFSPTDEARLPTYLQELHSALPGTERSYALAALVSSYLQEDATALPAPILAALAAADVRPSVTCHNDLNPWNIMVTDSGWVTLDWEFVGRNDPLFDLVNLHQGLELPTDNLEALAHDYLKLAHDKAANDVRAVSERVQRALLLFWLREFSWARYQLRQGNVRDEIEEQLRLAWTRLGG